MTPGVAPPRRPGRGWTAGALVAALLVVPGPVERTATAEPGGGSGLVVDVDRARGHARISCGEMPGGREGTLADFTIADPTALEGLLPGTMVEFAVSATDPSRIERLRARRFTPTDAQGLKVAQLHVMERIAAGGPPEPAVQVGQEVPDFTLVDQRGREVTVSALAGKTVAVSFMYTSCHLPDYCFRITNHFGLVQKRFANRLGRDLVLLTITFDPVHDSAGVLARYGETWKADAEGWHLLGGSLPEVRRVCRLFGMNAWPEMGMMAHDLRTVVIDRRGRLMASIEGNDFSARQLGDLIESALDRP